MTRWHLSLLLLAALSLLDGSVAAQEPSRLIVADPSNRSSDAEVSRLIAQLIAERSASAAVKARAARAPQWGRLEVGADEILAEIGALDALGAAPRRAAPATRESMPEPIADAGPEPARTVQAPPRRRSRILDKPPPGGGGGAGGW
jgi:hypothetical protein